MRLKLFCLGVKVLIIILTLTFMSITQSQETMMEKQSVSLKALNLLVINKTTKEPIPEAELTIRFAELAMAGIEETIKDKTDMNGQCKINLEGKPRDYVRVIAEKEGYAPSRVIWSKNMAVQQVPSQYTLTMMPGIKIGGKVQNEQGEPIEGVTVGIFYRKEYRDSQAFSATIIFPEDGVKTDKAGYWEFNKIPADFEVTEDLKIFLNHPDYISDNLRPGYIPMPVTAQPSLSSLRDSSSVMVMKKGISLRGRVLDSKGAPIKGASVTEGADRMSKAYPDSRTDEEGGFVFKNVKTGTMTLTVQASGYSPDIKKVTVKEKMEPVEFQLEPGHIVSGRIVDEDGNPVAGANIGAAKWRGSNLLEWGTVTDAEGRFHWNEAPADEVFCYIMAKDFMGITDYLIIGSDKDLVITLQPPLNVHGKVLDAQTGELIPEFKMVTGMRLETSNLVYWERENLKKFSDGKFENKLTDPFPGYIIQIEADGYLPAISRTFRNDEGDVTYDFKLEKAAGLSGVVFLPDGKPANGAEVILCTPSESMYVLSNRDMLRRSTRYVITKEDGKFSFPAQTDKYIILVFHNDGYAKITDSQFEASSKIILQPYATIRGKFLIKNTQLEAQKMYLTYVNPEEFSDIRIAQERRTETGSDGNFMFNNVPPGQAIIYWEIKNDKLGSLSYGVKLDIKPGQVNNVSIGDKGRPITGKILIPDYLESKLDLKYADKMLSVNSPNSPYTQIAYTVKKDGSFRIEDVPAGDYTLFFSAYETPEGDNPYPTKRIGMLIHKFRVPETAGGASDEPLDIGELELVVADKSSYIPSLAGKALPELKDFINLPQAEIQKKSILLCFWDSEQRPSRNCVLELSKEAEGLKAKDIEVILIHASKTERENLDKWLKENTVDFPVGMIETSEEQTRFNWGVKALPWLILTDKEHNVRAEGFSIDELDGKIKD